MSSTFVIWGNRTCDAQACLGAAVRLVGFNRRFDSNYRRVHDAIVNGEIGGPHILHIDEAGDLDTAVISLKFENGIIGTIDNSRQAVYGYDQRVEVLGSEGAIRTEKEYPNRAVLNGAEHVQRDPPLYPLHGICLEHI